MEREPRPARTSAPQGGGFGGPGFQRNTCLQEIRFTSCNEAIINDLLKILVHPTVNPNRISKAVISALQCYSRFKEIFEIYKSNINEEDIDYFTSQFSSIPLLDR